MEGPPNWLDMPYELMANILQRLGTVEILNSVWKVCTTWRKICKDPAMWNVIDVDAWDSCYSNYNLETLTKKAVDLSCGELIDISIDGFVTDDLIDYMLLRSNKLKSLCLMSCEDITGRRLGRAVKRVPHLEKLHLSYTYQSYLTIEDIKLIGQNCPQLKSFSMNQEFEGEYEYNDNDALAIAKNMPELRHLQVIGNNMTNIGLETILNGCPHLESLDVRRCFNLNLRGNLEKLCPEWIKDFKPPNDSMQNCGFYHLNDAFEHDMCSSGYSDVDESLECDFYEEDNFFWRHQHF